MAPSPEVIDCSSSAIRTLALACFITLYLLPLPRKADDDGGWFRRDSNTRARHGLHERFVSRKGSAVATFDANGRSAGVVFADAPRVDRLFDRHQQAAADGQPHRIRVRRRRNELIQRLVRLQTPAIGAER